MRARPKLLFLLLSILDTVFSHIIRKRILRGYPVFSHDEWETYHAMLLVESWACITNQIEHELGGCNQDTFCSGVLLTADFVVTACHCGEWQSYYLRPQSDVEDIENVKRPKPKAPGGLLSATVILKPQVHKFYSSIAILGGSPIIAEMKQKRHAERVFPHPNYKDASIHASAKDDIALIKVCVPFQITKTLKPPPMLPAKDMKRHLDRAILESAICLFAGYGVIDAPDPRRRGDWFFAKADELHYTWRYFTCTTVNDECVPQRNPCTLCSYGLVPRFGVTDVGDSGSPIVCNKYWTGISIGGVFNGFNRSYTVGYALYCIKDAITPDRLKYYKSLSAEAATVDLSPI